MRVSHLSDFIRGWFIGDFEPAILRTNGFEVGVLTHRAGEVWPTHYHKEAEEINVLLDGQMVINTTTFQKGDIFVIEKNEVSSPQFLTDCTVLVIKVPSVIGDKYVVND